MPGFVAVLIFKHSGMLAKSFRPRNTVHKASQLQWVERDIYCSSHFHIALVCKKIKGIFKITYRGPSFPSQTN